MIWKFADCFWSFLLFSSELQWQWHKTKQLIRKSELRTNYKLRIKPLRQLSGSTESSVCLKSSAILQMDYAHPETCITKLRKKQSVCVCVCTKGFTRTQGHAFSWLQSYMTKLLNGLCTCRHMWLKNCTHTEVFMPERDYVLWQGNLPWQSSALLSDSQSTSTLRRRLLIAQIQKCISNSQCYDKSLMPYSNAHMNVLAMHQQEIFI